MTYILGINAYHADASACIVKDGKLIAAVEEERFIRIKHWAGFPAKSIKYCLEEAGISLNEVDHIAVNRDPRAQLFRRIAFHLKKRTSFNFILNRLKNAKTSLSLNDELNEAFPDNKFTGEFHNVEHHLAHLASAFLVSPFEEAAVVSIDGSGDFASAAWGVGKGNTITQSKKVFVPHSLGVFYEAVTQLLGFPNYGDEYKIMGLAPYGEPKYLKEMRNIVITQDDGGYKLNSKYFVDMKEFSYEIINGEIKMGHLFSDSMESLLCKARNKDEELTQQHKDIARSAQAMYEEAFFNLLNKLHEQTGMTSLAIAGGCGNNSVANGRIYQNTPFEKVYVQSAAGDAGGAIGAAYYIWHQTSKAKRDFVMDHAYWGPHFDSNYIENLLENNTDRLKENNCTVEKIEDNKTLCDRTAQEISKGNVIGWFQGRMEWGPRALGNRSILCDPRRSDVRDILNLKIKRRESFRPFAPSILREAATDWFETDDDVPFMMQVFQVKEEQRSRIPAVTHADGSGRLQTVFKKTNPLYYMLIESFNELTGVPIILNTSFNENEPVVCKPEEAMDCFLRTKMDVLVLGDYFITR